MTLPLRYLTDFRSLELPHRFCDILVIGSGVAGLRAALSASDAGVRVLLATKADPLESNTRYAQGGIAVPLPGPDDLDLESHVRDTVRVGGGLCDEELVEAVIREGVGRVQELIEWGAAFDRTDGRLSRTREGGHDEARVLHARGDQTGLELAGTLLRRVRNQRNLQILDQTFVLDLLTDGDGRCRGVIAENPQRGREVLWADATILATGGAGQLYRETTNPSVATGDGIAMAVRAGATVADMEFMQFHPTTLYVAGSTRALISEAVRGEGAILRDRNGERFMEGIHPDRELAPRDVVSRAIVRRMQATDDRCVYLDLSHLDGDRVRERFPFIAELCSSFGIDLATDPIPVRPSAHYLVGGIRTDARGRTSIEGLLACGECACTGFHGANRLASNSLLEGLVMGVRASQAALDLVQGGPPEIVPLEGQRPQPPRLPADIQDAFNSLRSLMTYEVGIERSAERLASARERVDNWCRYVFHREFGLRAGWELQNMLLLARIMILLASKRTESRGVHYRLDMPEPREEWARHSEADIDDLARAMEE